MKAYQADIAKFESTDTQVFGMSVDSVPANREFAKQIGITFPLLSDFKRTVVKDLWRLQRGAGLWKSRNLPDR